MIHETVIAAFLLVWLHGESDGGLADTALTSVLGTAPGVGLRAGLILVPHLAAIVGTWAWLVRLGRRMDRGDAHALVRADAVLLWSRVLVLLWHAASVLALGWVGLVRSWIGNTVALDELVAATPPIAGLLLGFAAFQPIERRVRDAMFHRVLHEGTPLPVGEQLHPTRTRWAYVGFWARQSVLPFLIPVAAVFAWIEAAERVSRRLDLSSGWESALQLAGAGAMVTLSPLLLKRLWSATPLPESALRQAILAVCRRSAVRVRELLVWPTHGTMLNAAVLGFLPGTRFILFTDSLLERLGDESIEAVTAHEVSHVKERHLAWLALSTAAAAGVLGISIALTASFALGVVSSPDTLNEETTAIVHEFAGAAVGVFTLAGAIAAFGWISRRFEWQADAFAAADQTRALTPEASSVSGEAAERVAEALSLVAAHNGIPLARFGFRHGSIRTRQRKLRALVGVPLANIPQDRTARGIKLAAVVGLGLLAGAYAAGWLNPVIASSPPESDAAAREHAS